MRWPQAAVAVLSLMTLTGCPSEFGKDGRIAKAIHKDAKENVLIIRRCTDEWKKQVCAPGKENSDACRECGGP